jgi:hypothetical protein
LSFLAKLQQAKDLRKNPDLSVAAKRTHLSRRDRSAFSVRCAPVGLPIHLGGPGKFLPKSDWSKRGSSTMVWAGLDRI